MAIYSKSVRQLMREEMVAALAPDAGQILTKQQAINWFEKNYPKIKEATVAAHLIRLSTNAPTRLHYSAKPGEDDVLFQLDGSHFRRYDPRNDPAPLTKGSPLPALKRDTGETGDDTVQPAADNEFAYEHDLRDYLAKNLHLIAPGLKLYEDEGVRGIEFPAGGRYIDILATDPSNNYVVIELKVSRGYDRVVGQLLRYMAWIQKHHADPGQTVRGVIVSRQITEDLQLACCSLPQVALYEYELSVSLKRIAESGD
jgi:endonuclease